MLLPIPVKPLLGGIGAKGISVSLDDQFSVRAFEQFLVLERFNRQFAELGNVLGDLAFLPVHLLGHLLRVFLKFKALIGTHFSLPEKYLPSMMRALSIV